MTPEIKTDLLAAISVPPGISLQLESNIVLISYKGNPVRRIEFDVLIVYSDAEIKDFIDGLIWIAENIT